jgi:hypothetical protein
MAGPLLTAALPSAIAGVGSLVGGLLGNRARRNEAQRDRQFQERMSNTAWQRAVADMEAAGINPAVAYSKGPASSPGGAMAQQSDVLSPAVSSAMAAKRLQADLDNIKAQNELLEAQTEHQRAQRGMVEVHLAGYGARWDDKAGEFIIDVSGMPRRAREIESVIMKNQADAFFRNILSRTGTPIAEMADELGWALPIIAGLGRFGSGLLGSAAQVKRAFRPPIKSWSQMLKETTRKGGRTITRIRRGG